MSRRYVPALLVSAAVTSLGLGLLPALADPAGAPAELLEENRRVAGVAVPGPAPRADVPVDRFDLAGGCYAVSAGDRWVVRTGDGFAATATGPAQAEPFHLQATDLGSYLLYGAEADFLAVTTGLTGTTAVGPATAPSPSADFVLTGDGRAATLVSMADEALATDASGALVVADEPGTFGFRRTTGCADFPEAEVNVSGPVVGGSTPYTETVGYLDAHLHTVAFEFIGGRVHCGRPWHRYGVTAALVDCPDHEPDGRGALLESTVFGDDPAGGHDTTGWPTFVDWPAPLSLTHEQTYYRWLERAWRSGVRMQTVLLVDNGVLCRSYPYKQNSCNEMDGVRLQAQRLRELERYVDAQAGGPGEGFLRIVTDPQQAREAVNAGKLALTMGIEVSVLFDCGLVAGLPRCDEAQIDQQLQEVYDLGVRQMELANKFDNALSGVTGDGGAGGVVINSGNVQETGMFWQMETCPTGPDGEPAFGTDRQQTNLLDDSGAPAGPQDQIFGEVLDLAGSTGAAPVYPPGPHCNVRGLSPLGAHLLEQMMAKGMLFDPDHMSALARTQALDLLQERGYSGIVSSHSWSDEGIYRRVVAADGVLASYAGDSEFFADQWRRFRPHAELTDQYWGFAWGADANGLGTQGRPRGADAKDAVTYPFTALGGAVVDRQRSGERVFDVNVDGVAHYGLYADWVEDLRNIAGEQIVRDLERGPEGFLQAWERAHGIEGRRCHSRDELTSGRGLGALTAGMTPQAVLETAGQPHVRDGERFVYCIDGDRTATATFADGALQAVSGRALPGTGAGAPALGGTGTALPATGGLPLAVLGLLGLVAAAVVRRRSAR